MKIALLGYGKMGKTIDELITQKYSQKHKVILQSDSVNAHTFSTAALAEADVAIEFTNPNAVMSNIEKCFAANVPVVVGTTGWYGKLDYVKAQAGNQQSLFYASNFSVGVYLFRKVNLYLADLMKKHHAYSVHIEETHHTEKKDAPSGTAITLAEDIIWKNPNLDDWTMEETFKENDLPIKSHRLPNVKGLHQIHYHSSIDSISIQHEAHNRNGFADGAIKAAEWLQNKKGVFTMKDMMER